MKRILIILMLFTAFAFGQNYPALNKNITDATAWDTTLTMNITASSWKHFQGAIGIRIDVDNIAGTTDSLKGHLEFPSGNKASTARDKTVALVWKKVNPTDAFATPDTSTWILPQTADSTKTIWYVLDPSSITTYAGYPHTVFYLVLEAPGWNNSFKVRVESDR